MVSRAGGQTILVIQSVWLCLHRRLETIADARAPWYDREMPRRNPKATLVVVRYVNSVAVEQPDGLLFYLALLAGWPPPAGRAKTRIELDVGPNDRPLRDPYMVGHMSRDGSVVWGNDDVTQTLLARYETQVDHLIELVTSPAFEALQDGVPYSIDWPMA